MPQGYPGVGTLAVTVTTDADNQIFECNPSGTGEANNTATITVTSALATYTVGSLADSGTAHSATAIDYVNTNGGETEIAFASARAPQTIDLLSPLPAITAPLIIDGTTQPGYSGTP